MNLVLSTIVLTIMLLPGAISLRAYYTSFAEKKSSPHIPFNELILRGILISILVQCTGVYILKWFNLQPDFQSIYLVMVGEKSANVGNGFGQKFLDFMEYNVLLVFICYFGSKVFKNIVRIKGWNNKYFSLRNTNYWFDVFSAKQIDNTIQKPDFIFLDVLFENNIIYSGILVDFNYSPTKDVLENIILAEAQKRYLPSYVESETKDCKSTTPRIIEGERLLLPANKILNLNLSYIKADQILNGVVGNRLNIDGDA